MKRYLKRIPLKSSVLVVLVLGLTIGIICTYTQYGTTFDEADQIALGKQVLSYYRTFGKDTSYLSLSAYPEFFLTHGPIIEVLRQAIVQILPHTTIDSYHLMLALFSVIAFYFIFQITYLLTKNIWVAFASFMLLLCFPRFYGDIFTNSKDIAPVVTLLGSVYFSIRYFLGKRTLLTLCLLGVSFAIGISLRPALMYAPVLFFILSFIQMISEKSSKKMYFIWQVILFEIIFIVFYISSPYVFSHPQYIFRLISASNSYTWGGNVLFDRIMYDSQLLPRYYLVKWIAISTPIITLLFFMLGNMYVIANVINRKSAQTYIYSYLFFLFWIPLTIVLFTKVIIYDAWRQFLFLSGPLIILASLGVYVLMQSKNRIVIGVGIVLFSLNILSTGREMVLLHPYEYIYFNSIVGGLKGAYGSYETDYWGASFKEATDWVVANQPALSHGTLYIFPCYPHLTTPYVKPSVVINYSEATVFYCFTRENRDKQLPGTVIHSVEREGVPLNVITMKQTH